MRMASRVLPLPLPTPLPSAPARPPSADGASGGVKADSVYAARAVPVRFYLPDGAPVVQEVVPPSSSDGECLSPTLSGWTATRPSKTDLTTTQPRTSSFPPFSFLFHFIEVPHPLNRLTMDVIGKPTTLLAVLRQHLSLLFPTSPTSEPYPLGYPVALGVDLPPEAEIAWLSACMCGADGWLRIGIVLRAE